MNEASRSCKPFQKLCNIAITTVPVEICGLDERFKTNSPSLFCPKPVALWGL